MVSENRHKTSIHSVPSVYLNFRQAIYKDKKDQTSTSIATISINESTILVTPGFDLPATELQYE